MEELPKGWGQAQLGELVELKYGKGLPEKTRRPGKNAVYGSNGVIGEHDSALTSGPTVIVGRKGSVGEVHISERPCWPIDTTYFIDEFPGIEPRYLFHLLKSLDLAGLDNSTAIPGLNREKAYSVKIDLPPSAEQSRIVEKLDRLMARSGRAREEIERIPKLVERYKQAVMAAAFSGELTEDWRREKEILDASPWPIPSSWMWKRIEDVSEIASNLVDPKEVLDFPHIAPNHIESGIPKLLPYKTVREDEIISPKNRFFPGQIVYSKIRPYLRKAVLVDFDGVCSADMYPIWPKIHPRYLLYWLISPAFNDISMEHQGRTVLPKINQKALYSLPIPVPPAEEQIEIASRIDQAFTLVDRVMAETRKSLGLLIQLEQQTFDKAFRGELVPQDPNDEPASVLLKRIQNARKEEINGRQKGRARRENSRSLFE